MRVRVQDVHPTDCNGQPGYAVTLWNDNNITLMTLAFATEEEATEAAELFKTIIARAILVASPPGLPMPSFGRRRTDVTGLCTPPLA